MQSAILRVARPTDDILTVSEFYTKGLGFEILASFNDHEGFDGVIIGRPDSPWHIEFTHQHGVTVGRAPTKEHLLVLYLPVKAEWDAVVKRVNSLGVVACKAENPYWDRHGLTFEDPDGYRVVLQNTSWPPGSGSGDGSEESKI